MFSEMSLRTHKSFVHLQNTTKNKNKRMKPTKKRRCVEADIEARTHFALR